MQRSSRLCLYVLVRVHDVSLLNMYVCVRVCSCQDRWCMNPSAFKPPCFLNNPLCSLTHFWSFILNVTLLIYKTRTQSRGSAGELRWGAAHTHPSIYFSHRDTSKRSKRRDGRKHEDKIRSLSDRKPFVLFCSQSVILVCFMYRYSQNFRPHVTLKQRGTKVRQWQGAETLV